MPPSARHQPDALRRRLTDSRRGRGMTDVGTSWVRARIAAAAVALVASVLAGCNGPRSDGAADGLAPVPVRAVGVAAIGVGSVLHLYSDDGAPPVRPIVAIRANGEGAVTWLGHAGFWIRLAGRSILIDPMLSERLDFLLPLGPRRVAAAPSVAAIERLDAVLITHADHDHFDLPTLRRLAARFPGARLVVPSGMAAARDDTGFAATVELEPGRRFDLGRLRLTSVPVHHYGRRDLVGLAPTPAVGWVVEGGGLRVFHSGDTAYGPTFRALGARHGRFDLALVPIGAYEPPAFFRAVHAAPEDAVAIAVDLRARRAVGHHWGTFALGPERPRDASRRFVEAARGRVDAGVLAVGETMTIGR